MDKTKVTEASRIYDVIYGELAKSEKYKITEASKTAIIEDILFGMEYREREALRVMCRHHDVNVASRISGIDKKILSKKYTIARRHMLSPLNISKAIHPYYNISKKTPFSETDFGGKKYIINALNKSGINTREKLLKHLKPSWFYLWTIPGCGDTARQLILTTIERW